MEIQAPHGPDINISGPMLKIVWILYAITVIVVFLRLYTQWRITHSLGLGDAMMACSLLLGTGIPVTLTIQTHYGLGRHFYYLTSHQKTEVLKYNYIGQPLGILAPAFGRQATCIMMLQLFGTTKTRRRILWAVFWQSLVLNLTTVVLILSQCDDVRTLWDPVQHPSYCWSYKVKEMTSYIQGSINSATDLFLMLIPLKIFWTLKISKRLKFGLAFLLGLSGFALVASIIKTTLLRSICKRGDYTFGTVEFFTWVIIEFTLVDIAASAPLILPLFRRGRKQQTTSSYEFNNMPNPTITISSARKNHKRMTGESDLDSFSPSHNSSVENILPPPEMDMSAMPKHDLDYEERDAGYKGWAEMLARERGDVDHRTGNPEQLGVEQTRRPSIMKQMSFNVSFDDSTVVGGTDKDNEMWTTKDLRKIPWEMQERPTKMGREGDHKDMRKGSIVSVISESRILAAARKSFSSMTGDRRSG